MSFMLDPEDPKLHNPLTTEEDKKDLIQAFRAQVQAKEQPKNEGAITFPKYGYPRCISARSLWPAYLGSDETVLILDSAKKREHVFIWATAYKTMEITNRELELFTTGLAMYEALESGKGFKAGEYRLVPPPTSSKGFIILALDLDAAKRLLSKRVITVRSPTKATTFFLQTEKSWGSHIIFDVANGGRNFEKDVLPRIYRACKEGILHDTTTKPGHATFNDLAYYQVPWNPKTHKGAKGLIWRVRFKYTLAAMEPTWMLPRHLGSGNRGVIEVRRSPLCSHCISYSHAQILCQWWREGLVAGSKTAPKDPVEAEWKVIESHPLKKLE